MCLDGLIGEMTFCSVLEGWRVERSRWRQGRPHPGEGAACVNNQEEEQSGAKNSSVGR